MAVHFSSLSTNAKISDTKQKPAPRQLKSNLRINKFALSVFMGMAICASLPVVSAERLNCAELCEGLNGFALAICIIGCEILNLGA